MDDCDLEKLSVAPAKLSPKFNRNVTEYESTVPSSIEKVKVDCLTSDGGASYQVFEGGGEKTIPLTEGGVTEIRIEVSAEDGTVKNYLINIKRLSASDASLNQLSLSVGKISPSFSMGCYEYTTTVPCTTEDITVKAIAPDKKCVIVVPGSDENFTLPLLLGETKVVVAVGSVDGTKTQEYIVTVARKQFPWPVSLKDTKLSMKYECPMLLTPMYNPVAINGSDPKTSVTQPCIDMLARRSKTNPFNESPLDPDWRRLDTEMDGEISNCIAHSVYAYKGSKDELPLRAMAKHAQSSPHKPSAEVDAKKVTESTWYKTEFESSSASTSTITNHKVEIRNWEKRLQHMASESNADILIKEAEKRCKAYRNKLPKTPGDPARYSEGEAPSDELQQASICRAAAIKAKGKDAKIHLMLAFLLEEQTFLDEMYGLATKEEESIGAGLDKSAKESSRLEECMAICKLRGVAPNAPLALQLRGIDEEYKSLLESGQSGRADHVQMLYAWRSKQALQGEKSALQRVDENDPLTQAYLKYMDAVATDPNNHLCNLHLGRMLIERGEHKEAIQRLQQAVGLKPVSVEARFLLGLALCLQDGGPGDRTEALEFLHEGLDHLLLRRQAEAQTCEIVASSSCNLHAEDIFRPTNIQVLRGLLVLAGNLQKKKIDGLRSAKEVYHCACLHAGMALCSMYHRGPLFQQIEWVMLNAHYALLEILIAENSTDTVWIEQRCRYLSVVIRSSTITRDNELLSLQEKVSQKLVTLNPCSSESLYLLGMAQLMIYDNMPLGKQNLQPLLEAKQSLEASVDLEGKPASGEVPASIKEQNWWKEKVAGEAAKQVSKEPAKAAPAARGAAARGRGRAAPAPTRGAAARGRAAPRAAPARGRAAPARGGRGAVAPTAASSNTKCDKETTPSKPEANISTSPTAQTPGKPAPINRVTHLARLGLARALARTDDEKPNARIRYEEVIKMAPDIHDAYIELADLLVRSDPLAAVDVYCSYPSSQTAEDSFDDAYLSGEIVSILMKHEKYEDTRLVEHMVKWGRVMGIGVLEKYMGVLDSKFKTEMLKNIYAGVHKKAVDDPDLAAFFKFKCWI